MVRNFADAHYSAWNGFRKAWRFRKFQNGFLTAKHLVEKDSKKIDYAVENIETQTSLDSKQNLLNSNTKDSIIVVSGLPRSGTSLMMQMLNNSGCKLLVDEKRKADESNPKGYFEYKQ